MNWCRTKSRKFALLPRPGASHMLMQDLHSHAIAQWLLRWIERNR
jgi:hypothetical protein